MNWRHGAKRTKALLEYLADAQRHQQEKNSEATAQVAAVDERNAALASTIGKLESLLTDALSRDPYVDLDSLKETPRIPAFGKVKPNKRDYLPEPPSSLASLLPWKRIAYRDKYEAAEVQYNIDRQTYDAALAEHQVQAERIRAETAAHNQDIERYKQDFDAGERQAVEDYFTRVLEKSALPAGFPKQATLAYVAEADELRIDFALPAIDAIPETQTYSYDVIRGEASPALMPPKQRRLLYSSVLAQICLRCIHEIFSADRTKKIDHIVFEGNADGINPSSGQPGRFRLVVLSLSRGQYEALNLECVEPRACLYGLGGRLSSKPDQLLALTSAAPEAGQDAAADDGEDLARLKRRINELEGAMHAKDLHITELKNLINEQRDHNRELASELEEKRDDVARLERQNEAQRERLAELAPALRDEQERNAELNALIQSRQDAIDHMKYAVVAQESNSGETAIKPDDASADTEPVETIDEWSAEDDMAEAGIFAPIGSDAVIDGADGARIPARPSPIADDESDKTTTLGELLQGTDSIRAKSLDEVVAPPDDLPYFDEPVTIIDALEGDELKLLKLMMANGWSCSENYLQSAFPRQFINPIIHDINERAYEVLDDNLIEEIRGLLVVDEEYRYALEKALKQAENPKVTDKRESQ